MNLDDALRWYGKRIDKEIGIMSAGSAHRTRWRRWRMGRDIAGRKGSRRTDEWLRPQLVGAGHVAHWRSASSSSSCTNMPGRSSASSFSAPGRSSRSTTRHRPGLARASPGRSPAHGALFPILSVSTACIGFRFGSAVSFHFPGNVGLGFRTSDW